MMRKLSIKWLGAMLPAIVITFAAFGPLSAGAETVPQKQAKVLAQEFLNEANGQVMPPVSYVWNARNLTTDRLFAPFYVYNLPLKGFVIISAENKTFPILGYSLTETFDPNRLGEKGKALLRSYATDIERIRYDSRVPEKAVEAWSDFPGYVKSILAAPYEVTDPKMTMEEGTERLERVLDSGLAEETASDIYSPEQWQSLINDELALNGSIAVGLIDRGHLEPVIVHGRKGDFYRLQLDKRNQWYMRLLGSELLSGLQIADFTYPTRIPLPEEADDTYHFYDDFAALTAEEERREQERYQLPAREAETLLMEQPLVNKIGGGHYAITLPEEVKMMTIYNLAGNICDIRTFKNTTTAHADLSIEPSGFYFAQLLGASGKVYGVKLSR